MKINWKTEKFTVNYILPIHVLLNIWVSIPLWHLLKALHMSPPFREPSLQIEQEDALFIGFFPRKLGLSACGLRTWEIIIYPSWLNLWENNDLTSFVFLSLTTAYECRCVPKRNYLRVVVLSILHHTQISYEPWISRSSAGGLIEYTRSILMCTSKKYCSEYCKWSEWIDKGDTG